MAKYCVNCGKEISREAEFCKFCGSAQSVKAAVSRTNRSTHGDFGSNIAEKNKKAKKTSYVKLAILTLIAIGVIAICIAGAIWAYHKIGEKTSDKAGQTTEQLEEKKSETDKNEEDAVVEEIEQEGTETNNDKQNNKTEESRFKVGETYTVTAKPNLRVRKGPGKEYDNINRGELKGNDYKQSVGTTDSEAAALDKGSKVVCLEMSGKWMRIESGWICTEDGGEILVE